MIVIETVQKLVSVKYALLSSVPIYYNFGRTTKV